MPGVGVYFVKPCLIASIAASQIGVGVLKSGSPAPKDTISIPSAFMAFAFAVIPRVGEGFRRPALADKERVFNVRKYTETL